MISSTTERLTARDRLLVAADELFYEEGLHTVGIDRVIERAGVAKATLYNTFGSKDELIKAYLTARKSARQQRITSKLVRYDTPGEKLLGVFDILGEILAEPTFRGCAFVRASSEVTEGSSVAEVCDSSRAWLRKLFLDLATAADARHPDALAAKLVLLYDGAMNAAYLDHDRYAAVGAREVAELLLGAATG